MSLENVKGHSFCSRPSKLYNVKKWEETFMQEKTWQRGQELSKGSFRVGSSGCHINLAEAEKSRWAQTNRGLGTRWKNLCGRDDDRASDEETERNAGSLLQLGNYNNPRSSILLDLRTQQTVLFLDPCYNLKVFKHVFQYYIVVSHDKHCTSPVCAISLALTTEKSSIPFRPSFLQYQIRHKRYTKNEARTNKRRERWKFEEEFCSGTFKCCEKSKISNRRKRPT